MHTTLPTYFSDRKAFLSAELSCASRVNYFLEHIEANRDLNAYVEVFAEEARRAAAVSDERFRAGNPRRLEGMVIGLKDNICYKDHMVTASSRILEGYVSVFSATVTERLLQEGAIIIGRLNCDEFAMGSSNETSVYGRVLNPLDRARVPGGSSGGSAAALAAGLAHVTLGSDTGGSIRQPAAFCGLLGLKPTYGRISRWGLLAYGSSFDQIGPFTHNVQDAALVMEVISGADEKDATASHEPVPPYSERLAESGVKTIAYLPGLLENESIIPAIRQAYKDTIEQARNSGYTLQEARFDYFDYLVPTYYVLTTAEASSNLSRYDGVRFGHRTAERTDLDGLYRKSRSEGFGWEVKRRIMLGTFVLSSGFYDAYYAKAQKVRRIVTEATDTILSTADVLLLPATPDTAFVFGENSDDPLKMYLQDIFTVQANVSGHPAIAFPRGTDEKGLPVGMQLIGRKFREDTLLALSAELMR